MVEPTTPIDAELAKARQAYELWRQIHAPGERTPREMFYFGYLAAILRRGCKPYHIPLTNEDWLRAQPAQCYFYPGRDCPGWEIGGVCSRLNETIPPEEGKHAE